MEALRERSSGTFDLPEGTVYPALHRLERLGLLQSTGTEAGGRRRRVYELSPQGREAARAHHREWAAFAAGVQAVLRGTA
jgi:PadR family transcriptional regulator PadR